jgi:site-specific recombinase XerD
MYVDVHVYVDDPLAQEVMNFVKENRCAETNMSYTHHQYLYIQWCKTRSINAAVPNSLALAAYLTHAWTQREIRSASVANTARSAVSDLYRYMNENERTVGESKIVRDVCKTITKIAEPIEGKDPLTKDHFFSIFPHVDLQKYIEVRAYYCMLLMYALGRRSIEMTRLETKNVVNDEANMMMIVTLIPAKQGRKRKEKQVVAYAPNNPSLNVGLWHEVYMQLRTKENKKGECEFLFQTMGEREMDPNTVRHDMKRLFEKANLPFDRLGTHSARRGAATAMAEDEVSTALIDTHCTWAGETRNRYIKPSLQAKARATQHLNK